MPLRISDKVAAKLTPILNKTQAKVLLELLRHGRLRDSKLKEVIGFKSNNTSAYHRRRLEKEGIIKGYRAIVDWEKLGYPCRFMVIAGSADREIAHQIERDHCFSAEEYQNKVGEMVITSVPHGEVILESVQITEEKMAIIFGYATSMDAAKSYCKIYLEGRYPGIETELFFSDIYTIEDFFISRESIEEYSSLYSKNKKDKTSLKRFKSKFLPKFLQ